MIFKIVNDFPNEFLKNKEGPFISLYQPTHRHRPDNRQDLIRYKNLLQKIEISLSQKYPKEDQERLLKPFYELGENKLFWNSTLDGLAVLSANGQGIIYTTRRPLKEVALVGDKFHTKPLIRIAQSADRYYLLGLNRNEFTLFEGNRYGFEKVDLDEGRPTNIKEVLGDQYTEANLSFGSYGGAGGSPMYHGHGGRKDEVQKDTERFFRYVDRYVLDSFSKPSGLPLILVSLGEHHGLFRNISRNPFLLKDGIKIAYDTLSIEELKEHAWNVLEPIYLEKTKKLVDEFKQEEAKFLASSDLAQVVKAAVENRISSILIEANRIIGGKIDFESGKVSNGHIDHPEINDVLDDLAEIVYNNKGEVVILPKERMPSETGVAAVFRY